MTFDITLYRKINNLLNNFRMQGVKLELGGMVADVGNAIIKGASAYGEASFPHSIRKLTSQDLEQLDGRGDTASDIFYVNGVPYRIGNTATRYGEAAVRKGAQRYTPGYYDVLMAILMWLCHPNIDGARYDLYYFGSHPPRDNMYREDIISMAVGTHMVESQGISKTFNIHGAGCFDEPVGGYLNVALQDRDPTKKKNVEIHQPKHAALVVDPGGFTLDMIIVYGGKPDFLSAGSYEVGVLDALERFEERMRYRHRDTFKRITRHNGHKIRDAFSTGYYNAEGLGTLDVRQERKEISDELMQNILSHIDNFGGIAEFPTIICVNGGAAALETQFQDYLSQAKNLIKGYSKIERAHMTTVDGGVKRAYLINKAGQL